MVFYLYGKSLYLVCTVIEVVQLLDSYVDSRSSENLGSGYLPWHIIPSSVNVKHLCKACGVRWNIYFDTVQAVTGIHPSLTWRL